MTQLALLAAPAPLPEPPAPEPTGPWADIGRWMVGEGPRPDCLPIPVGTVREVVRDCGCRRRERMGAVGWLSAGRSRLCGEHRIWQEAM